ncbi:MAG: putative Fe-S cluster assembly protein SufT [Nevskiales bacterium]
MHAASETVILERDLVAVRIPAGDKYELPAGTKCRITQALGGSFTIYIEGHLFRVDGVDADALGKTLAQELSLPADASDADVEQLVMEQLRSCYDPEIPINIVELGLIYESRVETRAEGGRRACVKMTLTAPGCGMGDILVSDIRSKLMRLPTILEAQVELTFDPPWNQSMMSEAARLQAGLI